MSDTFILVVPAAILILIIVAKLKEKKDEEKRSNDRAQEEARKAQEEARKEAQKEKRKNEWNTFVGTHTPAEILGKLSKCGECKLITDGILCNCSSGDAFFCERAKPSCPDEDCPMKSAKLKNPLSRPSHMERLPDYTIENNSLYGPDEYGYIKKDEWHICRHSFIRIKDIRSQDANNSFNGYTLKWEGGDQYRESFFTSKHFYVEIADAEAIQYHEKPRRMFIPLLFAYDGESIPWSYLYGRYVFYFFVPELEFDVFSLICSDGAYIKEFNGSNEEFIEFIRNQEFGEEYMGLFADFAEKW